MTGAGRLVFEHTGGQVIAQYEYGYLDKVIQVTRGDQVTQFHYNARGMLVAKERDGQIIETFGWDGIGLLAKNETVYANEAHISGGVPLAAIDAGSEGAEMQYFDSDYLGTTTAVYSASGEVDAKLASSFGAGTESGELRFTGKPYDADLDAHVFPYRNYKSEAGNWASADPAGFPDGPNQHYYAAVPTMGVDPLGLWQARWTAISGMHGTVEAYKTGGGYEQVDVLAGNDASWGWGNYTYNAGTSTGSSISGSSSMLTNHSNWGESDLQASGEVQYTLELMADHSSELNETFRIELSGTLRVDADTIASLNFGAATIMKIGWISGQTQVLNLNSSGGSQVQNQVSLAGDWDPGLTVGQWTSIGYVLGSHAWSQFAGGTAGGFFDYTATVSEL